MLTFVPKADTARGSAVEPFRKCIHRSFVQLHPATATAGDVVRTAQEVLHAYIRHRNAYRGDLHPSSTAVQITEVWGWRLVVPQHPELRPQGRALDRALRQRRHRHRRRGRRRRRGVRGGKGGRRVGRRGKRQRSRRRRGRRWGSNDAGCERVTVPLTPLTPSSEMFFEVVGA